MIEVIQTSYEPLYVGLSLFCAFMGAYTALSCVHRLLGFRKTHFHHRLDRLMGKSVATAVPSTQMYYATLLVGGVAFGGLGVWAMHFIGTLALRMPIAVNYSISYTLLSFLAAAFAASLGLGIVAVNPNSTPRLVIAGAVLGLGVSTMHYLGMGSMNFDGFFVWNWGLVVLSCMVAFAASTVALKLAFATESNHARMVAAVLMGGAVGAMHYTGMAAANVVCSTSVPLQTLDDTGAISMPQMPVLLVLLVVIVSFLLALDRMYTQQFRQ